MALCQVVLQNRLLGEAHFVTSRTTDLLVGGEGCSPGLVLLLRREQLAVRMSLEARTASVDTVTMSLPRSL